MQSKESAKRLLEFINQSPTCFHTIENVRKALEEEGFMPLTENTEFQLQPEGKYYVIRNGASMIAFQVPREKLKGFHLIASHCDTPCFKVKENPEITVENTYVVLNVEKYGGSILSTWLDRPLSIAGRVIVKKEEGLGSHLVHFEEDLCVIPNLAIHLNREINKGVEYNPQTDMRPLFSSAKEADLKEKIATKLGIQAEDILGTDLFLFSRTQGCFLGKDGEFIGAPRLDDTMCVFSSLQGFLQAENKEYMKVYCVFDHEEVGSRTRQGADSDFLQVTLEKISRAVGGESSLASLLADSFLLSADNGHGLHPNHPEKSDPTNRPVLNGGIVIKYHGNQQYTTDAFTGAVVKAICDRQEIPWQTYHNRSDIPGGSTLGNISISHCSIPSADVGLAQLSMHSAFETAGALDTEYFIRFARAFYESGSHRLV
ncbi:MAG: M18 family aminopeptidase [Lachnospiraceae bacterium]|nr:M18 family aminopeptidase [Lachnospiraceae bacterium]